MTNFIATNIDINEYESLVLFIQHAKYKKYQKFIQIQFYGTVNDYSDGSACLHTKNKWMILKIKKNNKRLLCISTTHNQSQSYLNVTLAVDCKVFTSVFYMFSVLSW